MNQITDRNRFLRVTSNYKYVAATLSTVLCTATQSEIKCANKSTANTRNWIKVKVKEWKYEMTTYTSTLSDIMGKQ